LCVFMLWIGVAPETFLKPSREALRQTLEEYNAGVERPEVAQATLRTTTMVSETGR
jgi:hypothetical protein